MDVETKTRNPWLDYLKAFAIYLVVVGHTLSNCMLYGGANRVNGIIYFIHIPMFLVISGLLVKDKPMDKSFWLGLLKRFVIPYTIWTVVLTTFYQGFSHLLHDGIKINAEVYLDNWCHSFLWFVKAYLVTYVLWQVLKKLSCWWRLMVGTVFLVIINLLTLSNKPLAEIASLSLYSYTLFGGGVCVRRYVGKVNRYVVAVLFGSFLLCLPFATPQNNYFECSFIHMLHDGDWYIFFVRLVAGVCISMALIGCGRACHQDVAPSWLRIIQGVGQKTLQIYMLQALLVEGALSRMLHFDNDYLGIIMAFGVALLMTFLCYIVIQETWKIKLCRTLLWGVK